MTREIWVTSDTHFSHENIISYCSRPFKNRDEMDEALIENWNSVVKPGDIVYHLGDVYMGEGGQERFAKIAPKLPGRKRLVLGNHDDGKDKLLQIVFQKIMVWRMMPDFGLLFTHVPVHESSLTRMERIRKWNNDEQRYELHEHTWKLKNIFGHIHEKEAPAGPYRCVCVEHTNYTPINIEELRVR